MNFLTMLGLLSFISTDTSNDYTTKVEEHNAMIEERISEGKEYLEVYTQEGIEYFDEHLEDGKEYLETHAEEGIEYFDQKMNDGFEHINNETKSDLGSKISQIYTNIKNKFKSLFS